MKTELAKYVDNYCKKHKVSKEKLAEHANMARSTLYKTLKPDTMPTLLNITKLAMAMQVHPQYLIKLEWNRYCLEGCQIKPVLPLQEPELEYYQHQDSSSFISETVPDGTIVCTNERFYKTWRLQNTGNTTWKGRQLLCQDTCEEVYEQSRLPQFAKERNLCLEPAAKSIDIPTTPSGDLVDLMIEMVAPAVPCQALSYWKMVDQNGLLCFPNSIGVYARVQVVSAGVAFS